MKASLRPGVGQVGLPPPDSSLPAKLRIPTFELSQSGAVFPTGYGNPNLAPLVPGLEGVEKMVVTALSESGTRFFNEFDVRDGVVQPNSRTRPLGHNPYEVAIVMDDGTRYSGVVDISPSKTGVSHQGYEEIKNLDLTREAPPPPTEVELAPFFLSQSGHALPINDKGPVVPNNDGYFESMVVTALSPSNTRSSNTYDIEHDGSLAGRGWSRPLGHNPYEIALVAKDGARYTAVVDISPSKTGVSHQGYDTMKLTLNRRDPGVDVATDAPMSDADAGFTKRGELPPARVGTSPAAIYLKNK